MKEFKVLIPARQIPDGSIVTKFTRNGMHLTLRRKLKIYSDEPEGRSELHTDGMVFLVSPTGNITAVAETVELICFLTTGQLEKIAFDEEMERESQ
jgi:hypothetical protein